MEFPCCDWCKYWECFEIDDFVSVGICHLAPPVLRGVDNKGDVWMRPETNDDDYCREFEKLEEKKQMFRRWDLL